MKKTVKMSLVATAILVSSIAVFTACDGAQSGAGSTSGSGGAVAMSVRDVYAMSAVSSVSYLSAEESAPAAAALPEGVTDSDAAGIESCIAAFDSLLQGGGVDQTVQDNTSEDARFDSYALEMNISLPVGSGEFEVYTLYFNELAKTTHSEKDGWEEEIEERTTFEGVLVYNEELFVVKGVKEVETEGKETETSLEFRTYKNVGVESVQADESNFVVVSQSTEKGELEYEYSFYESGRKVQEIELEYEETLLGVELSFQIKDMQNGRLQETEYELRKKDDGFVVEFEKNGKKQKFTVTKTAEGYRFD